LRSAAWILLGQARRSAGGGGSRQDTGDAFARTGRQVIELAETVLVDKTRINFLIRRNRSPSVNYSKLG